MASKSALTAEDVKVGSTYRGKRFQQFFNSTNDRVVVWPIAVKCSTTATRLWAVVCLESPWKPS